MIAQHAREGAAGASIILWSYVNYRILISGEEKNDRLAEEAPSPAKEIEKTPTIQLLLP
jgi:hypothetical protein